MLIRWSILIGGIMLGVVDRVQQSEECSILTQSEMNLIKANLKFFDMLAFLFLGSIEYIGAVETSILSSVELLIIVTWLSNGGNKAAVGGKSVEHRNV